MKLPRLDFQKSLTAALVIGCLFHPFASCVALLIFLAHQLADKYFTSNISDKDRKDLQTIKAEIAEVKLNQQTQNLTKAFSRTP